MYVNTVYRKVFVMILVRPMLQVAPPAFLPVPGPRGLYQQGHGLAIFLNSRGEVTAYSAHGEHIWQVRAQQLAIM
jgi:hypothetical protein